MKRRGFELFERYRLSPVRPVHHRLMALHVSITNRDLTPAMTGTKVDRPLLRPRARFSLLYSLTKPETAVIDRGQDAGTTWSQPSERFSRLERRQKINEILFFLRG